MMGIFGNLFNKTNSQTNSQTHTTTGSTASQIIYGDPRQTSGGYYFPQQPVVPKNYYHSDLDFLKQIKPANHVDNYKDLDGFKWLDEEHEWALCPESKLDDSAFAGLFSGLSFQYNFKTATQAPPIPPVHHQAKSQKEFKLLHRHDNDLMIEMLELNERYHGHHSFICKECHKPVSEEYRMIYVLQNSLAATAKSD